MTKRSAELFARCFGHLPEWMVAAPGRVNLIGEHTDYNDGFVLPMALERHTLMAAERNGRREVTLLSVTTGETARFSARNAVERGEPAWSNYVRGVIAGFQRRGHKIGGFDAIIDSTVPYGGGVSSSAALEVASATLLEEMVGHTLDPMEKALLCQEAEHEFAGVPCGLMDQFTSVLAQENHALLLDCRSRTAKPVPMTDPSVSVMVINTNVRHNLMDSAYGERRSQCQEAALALKVPALRDASLEMLEDGRRRMQPIIHRRARHVVSENSRALGFAQAIHRADWTEAGQLMYASHESLRHDYEVSCPELDTVVEIARGISPTGGMIGCRMTGAGFGGCAVSLVRTEALSQITREIDRLYERKTGQQPTLFSSRPGGGARVLKSGR